jgi:hypothetical protein
VPDLDDELARERAEVARLRELLVARDNELGVARGRLREIETALRIVIGPIRRGRAMIDNGLRSLRG